MELRVSGQIIDEHHDDDEFLAIERNIMTALNRR